MHSAFWPLNCTPSQTALLTARGPSPPKKIMKLTIQTLILVYNFVAPFLFPVRIIKFHHQNHFAASYVKA